jgi:hypothetical protein
MTIVTIIVMTAYALSAPVSISERTPVDPPSAAGFDWILPLLIVASVIGTWFAWVVLAERRWPWPVGKRRDRRSDTAWTAIPAIAAWVVAQFIRASWTPASGVYFRGEDEPYLVVSTPVDLARDLVLFGLCWSIAQAVGHLIDHVVRRRRRLDPASPEVTRPAL